MNVKSCNLLEPLTADVEDTILSIAKKMKSKKVRQFTIVKSKKPVGIVSAVDIVNKVVALAKDPAKVKAKDIMTSPIYYCHAEDSALKTYYNMSKDNIISCPVIEDEKLIGTLTMQNVIVAINQKGKDLRK